MSTYNGETYLQEQIDSILRQEEVEVTLYIRDDGSSDRTPEMLNAVRKTHSNVIVFPEKNIGVGNSFYQLLYKIPAGYDYYAFADQDDIWEPRKLAAAARKLEETGCSLYASNQECVDAEGNSQGLRYGRQDSIHLRPLGIMSQNTLAGCTMVFPQTVFKKLTDIKCRPSEELLRLRIHDVWTAMAASVLDGIVYDPASFIRYRQHANNVVGAAKAGFGEKLREKIGKIKDARRRNGRSMIAREIFEKYHLQPGEHPVLYACAYPGRLRNRITLSKNSGRLCRYTGEQRPELLAKIWLGLF